MEKLKEIFKETFKKQILTEGFVYYGSSARFVIGVTHSQKNFSALYMEHFLVGEVQAPGIFFVKKNIIFVPNEKNVERNGAMAIHKRDKYLALYERENTLHHSYPGYVSMEVEEWIRFQSFGEIRHSLYRDVHRVIDLYKQANF